MLYSAAPAQHATPPAQLRSPALRAGASVGDYSAAAVWTRG